MTRFKARIWRSGTSNVLTIPVALIGVDYKLGDEVVVSLENFKELNPHFQILTGNLAGVEA